MQKRFVFVFLLCLIIFKGQITFAQRISTDQEQGDILDGLFIDKAKADTEENYKAEEKSAAAQEEMAESGVWLATNYAPGDINSKEYTVKKGDTLWEIAESRYSSGYSWTKIVELNPGKIGTLQNGQQALIFPGQILVLEAS